MNPDLIPFYFSEEELLKLKGVEGRSLSGVIYTVWRNVAKKAEIYEALDWISLFFEEKRLDFTIREDQQGMELKELNFSLEQTRVAQQFNGQVELKQVDMSESPVWGKAIGLPLNSVGLSSPIDGYFQSNLLQLEFTQATMEIALGQEGLIAYQL
ncbi:MAG: hypothetical protein MRZ79_19060 [Bacteroidia bacterium]|nr:hypothetical protein [Bacteroidia bacterium]